jgi:general secretion pathway protein D
MKLGKILFITILVLLLVVDAQGRNRSSSHQNSNTNNTNQDDEYITLNFRNMGLQEFVTTIGKITNKNILINGNLQGKINFISTKPIKKSSLFSLANSILASKGYALVDHGDFMEVVKASEAAGMGLKVDNNVEGETMKTVLFPLKNSNASVVRAKIRPLLHRNAKVISFKENNVLAVTAYPKTLKSIKKLIDSIESAGHKGSLIIKLKNANVKDVYTNAVNMAKLLFPQTIPSEKVGIFKDASSNSIIIVGKRSNVEQMAKFVRQLDQKGESVDQKLYVIPLQNSNVEDMEKILGKLIAQMNSISMASAKGGKKPQKAMVVGDKERNSLIVLATGEEYKNIMQVVKRIDVEKPQVYIKARVVEINSRLAQQIGTKYGFEGGTITTRGLFSLASNLGAPSLMISQQLLSFITTQETKYDQNGNPITDYKNPFSFGNVDSLFALGVKLDLLQNNGAARVLSEPSVLCTNNQESELYVGETRSVLTSSSSGTNKDDVIRNNWSREDIGLTLKVKPRLSSNNKVALKVDAVVEDVVPGTSADSPRPTTTKRKVTTNAIVKNGETVILGGLIKNSSGRSVSKVPFLGDIPIIGRIFSDEGKMENKVELVIYLTPYIVRRSEDLVKLRKFLSELEDVQKRYADFIAKHMGDRSFFKKKSSSRSYSQPVVEEEYVEPESTSSYQRPHQQHRDPLSILRSHP